MIPTGRPSKKYILCKFTRETFREVFHHCTVLNRHR
jgi:hypothetical protein